MRSKLLHIVIALAIAVVFGYLLIVAFAGDPLEKWAKVDELHLMQNGLEVTAYWSDEGCDSYEVKVWHDGRLTVIPHVKGNTYTTKVSAPGEHCVIMVSGHLRFGIMTRSAKAEITVEKLNQNIFVADTAYYGFDGNDFNLKASAYGDLHYRSTDKNIASVDQTGTVALKNVGEAFINIRADGNGLYEDAEREVSVFVYPTVFEKVKGAVAENISPSRAIIRWKKNEYAAAYTVLRRNPATQQYEVLAEKTAEDNFLEVTRDDYDYEIKATAEVNGEKVDGKVSDPVKVRGTTEKSPSYSKFKIIKKITKADLNVVAAIHGAPKARVPQSINMVGDDCVVSFVNMKNTEAKLIAYNKADGSTSLVSDARGIGHGNGGAYNPHTNKIYILSKKSGNVQSCCVFDGDTLKMIDTIKMPVACTAIAYDISTDKFYLAKKDKIYICSSNFRVEKTITKTAPYFHTQDMGAYNGAVLVCTWPQETESYLDVYRVSDGAYLGSYDLSIGEIESVTMDDGYLVILMNTIRSNDDRIYKTKERIAIP